MKVKDLKGISNRLSTTTLKLLKRPVFYIALIIVISILVLNVKYPIVGCDYSYFVPRLLDNHLFYLKNGLKIQWWTPSFGGGLPSHPNPQQMQFSLPQLFLFIANPWISINLTIIILLGIGFYSTFFLFRRLSFPEDQAILGATLFSITGFFIEHLSVGHLGYIGFPLLPLFIILLINDKLPILITSIGIALIFSFLIHSAGFYVIVIFIFSVPISLLIIYILSIKIKPNYLRLLLTSLMGVVTGVLISSSKLIATWSHLKYFPRYVNDIYDASILKSILGFLSQLFLTPIAIFFKDLPITELMQNSMGTGSGMGLWETDIGLSPIILGILLSSCFLLRKVFLSYKKGVTNSNHKGTNKKKYSSRKIGFLLLLIILFWISFELITAKGLIYKQLKNITFMRSLHVNVRFASIFILPIIIFSMFAYKKLKDHILIRPLKKVNLSLLLCFTALVFYTQYINIPIEHGCLNFNISQSGKDWKEIRRSPGNFKINSISPIGDSEVFNKKSSSLFVQEPLFGYKLETFKPKIKPGPIDIVDSFFYNFTNPVSLVFPEQNNLSKFQRISISDTENFKKFITYNLPKWRLSKIQQISNYISIYTIILMVLVFLFYFAKLVIKKSKKKVRLTNAT